MIGDDGRNFIDCVMYTAKIKTQRIQRSMPEPVGRVARPSQNLVVSNLPLRVVHSLSIKFRRDKYGQDDLSNDSAF